jgi:hypothetical protein
MHKHCDSTLEYPGSKGASDQDYLEILDYGPLRGVTFNTCLLPMVNEESKLYMEYYQYYAAGYLAMPGGAAQQPRRYLQAMLLIDDRLKAIDMKRAEKKNGY